MMCRETYIWLVDPCFLTEKWEINSGIPEIKKPPDRSAVRRRAVLRAARGRCSGRLRAEPLPAGAAEAAGPQRRRRR